MENFIKIDNDSISVSLSLSIKNVGNKWTIFSPQLYILSFSKDSKEDALKDFEENLNIFFKINIEEDTLEDALKEFGWENKTKIKDLISRKSDYIPMYNYASDERKGGNVLNTSFSVPLSTIHAYA